MLRDSGRIGCKQHGTRRLRQRCEEVTHAKSSGALCEPCQRLQGEIERREILVHRTNEYRWRLNNLEALRPYMQPSEATPDTPGER